MCLALRHGLTGEVLLTIDSEDGLPTGWEIMVQMATHLGLTTPFQIILCPNQVEQNHISPFQAVKQPSPRSVTEMSFVIRHMQEPTAEQYHSMVEALRQKNPTTLSILLGQGLDLSLSVPGGGHTSALVALAMLRDHDHDDYVAPVKMTEVRYPSTSVCLTHLVLQAKASPNIVPPKQQPTSMIGLAVALGNQDLVDLLLNSAAEVHPEIDTVPPLMIAVLNEHQRNVQSLRLADANPWQSVPVGALMDLPCYHLGMFSWREPVCALQVAVAKGHAGICSDLMKAGTGLWDTLEASHANAKYRPTLTALSERATMLLARAIADYEKGNGPHMPRLGRESLRWAKCHPTWSAM